MLYHVTVHTAGFTTNNKRKQTGQKEFTAAGIPHVMCVQNEHRNQCDVLGVVLTASHTPLPGLLRM